MSIFLGLDLGGSKTEAAVADDAAILGRGTAESSQLVRVGEYCAGRALHAAIRQACMEARLRPEDVTSVVVGLAGVSRQRDTVVVRDLVRRVVSAPTEIVSDAVIAHEAAFGERPGVIVIAGTGSIVYGRNENGSIARAGGWGPVASDEGSGDWIGRQAIAAIVRAIDTAKSTALTQAVSNVWQLTDPDEIARFANTLPPPDFAGLVPAIFHAADEGDTFARELLSRAGVELGSLCRIVLRRLWPGAQPVRVAVSGGVLNNSTLVRRIFENTVSAERPEVAFVSAHVRPVDGAIALARRTAAAAAAAHA